MSESPTAPVTVTLPDLAATQALAGTIARRARRHDVIALSGGLGTGKTAFARAFIQARPGGDRITEVPSPTFTLVQVYDLPDAPVWHFDLYRLARAEDAWELGIEEAFAEAISLIEWPDRLGGLLPAERLDVHLTPGDSSNERRAALTGRGGWALRLDNLHG